MKEAKLINIDGHQAVNLPDEFHFAENEVFIKRMGNAVVLLPMNRAWQGLTHSLTRIPTTSCQNGNSQGSTRVNLRDKEAG